MSISPHALPLALVIALSTVACQNEDNHNTNIQAKSRTRQAAPTMPAGADPRLSRPRTQTFHWQCNEVGVASAYDDHGEHVTLSFSGRTLELPIAIAASGARYADAAGNEFWTKGESGTLILAEALRETAKLECSRTDRPSPWYLAAERGVGFRASGGEPGWFVEVEHGENPVLRATLGYGERKIKVARVDELGGDAFGYLGQTVDGTDVTLFIQRIPCQDGMSGAWFEATARLEVGESSYLGCGAFLIE